MRRHLHPTEDGQVMHSGIVEIYVGPSANLRFVELQSWGSMSGISVMSGSRLTVMATWTGFLARWVLILPRIFLI
jgi:Fe-S cluster assembly scaffold protein SufB